MIIEQRDPQTRAAGKKCPYARQRDRAGGLAYQPGGQQPHSPAGAGGRDRRLHRAHQPAGQPHPGERPHQPVHPPLHAGNRFLQELSTIPEVLQCFHLTGSYSFIVKVSCGDMEALERLITLFQKAGPTQ